jgi:cytochrome c peroxidase
LKSWTLCALIASLASAVGAMQSPRVPADALPADFGAEVPRGLGPLAANGAAPSPDVVALGRALFFDPILSADRTVSCASCHDPKHGFADARPLSSGIRGQEAVRNTPTLFNRGFGKHFSWTGKAATLAEQVLLPIENPLEMGSSRADAVARIGADERLRARFVTAFGAPPSVESLSTALSAFVARIHNGDSAVDKFQAGDFAALDDQERAGLWIYESKGGCWRCHTGPNYSDEEFHATGVGAHDGKAQAGRFEVSADPKDRGRFKTPTLRGLALTAPYMHDGSVETLEGVVDYYVRGGNACGELDELIHPVALSKEERAALTAFLRALSRPAGS